MRKKRVPEDGYFPKVIRKANERDLEKLDEVRQKEMPIMVRARAIARTLNLKMKIGDVEFQGDGRKATFYYTAEGRVDFRELIRHFAKEFKIKVEMRQIGARQESARIGGLGPCGRELCCSTWLTTYRSVSTAAARYQNLAINQAKLSGQCGRLKCCLNYELDTYMEAISEFPENADKIKTEMGLAVLLKTDIFKGLMFYGYKKEAGRGRIYPLELDQVREVLKMNKRGEMPSGLADLQVLPETSAEEEIGFADDVTNVIDLPMEERRRKKKRKPRGKSGPQRTGRGGGNNRGGQKPDDDKTDRPPKSEARDQGPKKEDGPPKGPDRKGKSRGGGRGRGRGRGRGKGNGRNRGGGKGDAPKGKD
jgi:cell fate regulator YaaT (PSP1 superfamily)